MDTNITYKDPVVFNFPGMIARVYSPVLTEAERAKRLDDLKKAAVRLLLEKDKKGRKTQ